MYFKVRVCLLFEEGRGGGEGAAVKLSTQSEIEQKMLTPASVLGSLFSERTLVRTWKKQTINHLGIFLKGIKEATCGFSSSSFYLFWAQARPR